MLTFGHVTLAGTDLVRRQSFLLQVKAQDKAPPEALGFTAHSTVLGEECGVLLQIGALFLNYLQVLITTPPPSAPLSFFTAIKISLWLHEKLPLMNFSSFNTYFKSRSH